MSQRSDVIFIHGCRARRITTDADGHVVEFNPAAERIFGFRSDETGGPEMAELIAPPHLLELPAELAIARLEKRGGATFTGHLREMTGGWRQREAALWRPAPHDSPTGLATDRSSSTTLCGALARAERVGSAVALRCFDLNDVKLVSESFGHAVGDEFLRATGRRPQARAPRLRCVCSPSRRRVFHAHRTHGSTKEGREA